MNKPAYGLNWGLPAVPAEIAEKFRVRVCVPNKHGKRIIAVFVGVAMSAQDATYMVACASNGNRYFHLVVKGEHIGLYAY